MVSPLKYTVAENAVAESGITAVPEAGTISTEPESAVSVHIEIELEVSRLRIVTVKHFGIEAGTVNGVQLGLEARELSFNI